jgi:hypothetical protein
VGSIVVWCCALILITRRLPPPRVLLFLAAVWCLFIGAGLSWLAGRIFAKSFAAQAAGALLVLALLSLQLVRSRAVLESEETDWVGMRDARDIAALIATGPPDDRVVINQSIGPPLDYYLLRLTGKRLADFADATKHRGRVLLVVDERHGFSLARVLPSLPEIPWGAMGRPTIVKRFPGAVVYAFSPTKVR